MKTELTKRKNILKANCCPNCNKKIGLNTAFCSRDCKNVHFELLKINFSTKFIKSTVWKFQDDKIGLETEVIRIAKFHNYAEDLALKRFFLLAKELKPSEAA